MNALPSILRYFSEVAKVSVFAASTSLFLSSSSEANGFTNNHNYMNVERVNGRSDRFRVTCYQVSGQLIQRESNGAGSLDVSNSGRVFEFNSTLPEGQVRSVLTYHRGGGVCPPTGSPPQVPQSLIQSMCLRAQDSRSPDCGFTSRAHSGNTFSVQVSGGGCDQNNNGFHRLQRLTHGTAERDLQSFCRSTIQAGLPRVRTSAPSVPAIADSPASAPAATVPAPAAASAAGSPPAPVEAASVPASAAPNNNRSESIVSPHLVCNQSLSNNDITCTNVGPLRRGFYDSEYFRTCRAQTIFARNSSRNIISATQIHRARHNSGNAVEQQIAERVFQLRAKACECTGSSAAQPSQAQGGSLGRGSRRDCAHYRPAVGENNHPAEPNSTAVSADERTSSSGASLCSTQAGGCDPVEASAASVPAAP